MGGGSNTTPSYDRSSRMPTPSNPQYQPPPPNTHKKGTPHDAERREPPPALHHARRLPLRAPGAVGLARYVRHNTHVWVCVHMFMCVYFIGGYTPSAPYGDPTDSSHASIQNTTTAEAPPAELFDAKGNRDSQQDEVFAFDRTVSRLMEMQARVCFVRDLEFVRLVFECVGWGGGRLHVHCHDHDARARIAHTNPNHICNNTTKTRPGRRLPSAPRVTPRRGRGRGGASGQGVEGQRRAAVACRC